MSNPNSPRISSQLPSHNGQSSGSQNGTALADGPLLLPEELDDLLFVCVDKKTARIVAKLGNGRNLDTVVWPTLDRERRHNVRGTRVVVVSPSEGEGRKLALQAMFECREGNAHAVRAFVLHGLGTESWPDIESWMKQFPNLVDQLYHEHFEKPWKTDEDDGAGEKQLAPVAQTIRASDVVIKPIEWLWQPFVPTGMISLFAGDPKLGKSLTTVGMAASVSKGGRLPMDSAERAPGSVILMSAEDDTSRVIVPRLKAAGADLDRVHILESIIYPGSLPKRGDPEPPPIERLPTILGADIKAIEKRAVEIGDCRLIIVDPVTAYIAGIDDHKNTELRGVLFPLRAMAERLNAAVVLVTHMSKGGATQAKHRVIGSIAWVGACRANFVFAKDAADPSGRRVLMCANGTNLAPDVPSLSYTIEDKGDGPVVAFGTDPVNITADEALAALNRDPEQQAQRRESDRWLLEKLKGGPILASEIESAAEDAGVSYGYLQRAKKRLGVKSEKTGFDKATWRWFLPKSVSADET